MEAQVTFRTAAERKISNWHNEEWITAIYFIKEIPDDKTENTPLHVLSLHHKWNNKYPIQKNDKQL